MKKDLYQEITNKIVLELEKGAAPWVKPWANGGLSSNPRNAVTSRPYSGVNVLLLWIAASCGGYANQRWLTYKQAAAAGGNVKKGERGTQICFMSPIEKPGLDANGNATMDKYFIIRGYTVFNVGQCDGLPERLTRPVKPFNHEEDDYQLREFLASTGAKIHYGGDKACYMPLLDIIQCPHLDQFRTAANFWSTQFHELTHWTSDNSRCKRKLGTRFGDNAYAMEEMIAELGAAFLCAELGVEHKELRHAGYIGHWLNVLRADKKAIFTAASLASKAAAYLMKNVSAEAEDCEALAA